MFAAIQLIIFGGTSSASGSTVVVGAGQPIGLLLALTKAS